MPDDFKPPVKPLPSPAKTEAKTLAVKTVKKESDLILEQMDKIQKESGGLLSDIPIDSEYWTLRNQFMSLVRSGK